MHRQNEMMHQYDAMSQRWIMSDSKALNTIDFLYIKYSLSNLKSLLYSLIFLEDELI